jgi:hypothetical protein
MFRKALDLAKCCANIELKNLLRINYNLLFLS